MMRFALGCSMRGVAAGSQEEPAQQKLASKEARVGELVLPGTQTGTRRQRQVAGARSTSGAPQAVDAACEGRLKLGAEPRTRRGNDVK